ncbi:MULTISPECIES: hypothetical protein [unclassified Bradyrhizobium]|uniref:hypothetical protein n=1 Tax=unclassified Bradyrhizobium TaxID=2631580 RepID=UPI001FF834C3|nr:MULTISPECIES: hypothetical protein [unclassified Bradyrhizobium]MCK1329495.1 hypothetical protein [Bradyrhizobium sp. CW9]MCK1417658.1 hypothetical protein [Bradyrhizobium sp. CW4]MCK1499348.1 hypothetical protein [Bradyrhizobium sp. 188]MCK1505431.1 hypothetical protein [Bradyrhizobium sp. 18]MCK1584239.1 hypothetical protein [Bradyrhizobium sp. 168]
MEVQAARSLFKTIGFVFGLFCLLLTYASGVRFYEHVLGGRSMPEHGASLALDVGGNVLLLGMSGFGLVAVLLIARRGFDRVVGNWPYVVPAILVAVFCATMAATLGARRMTWVLPAASLFGLIGLWAGWSVLRQHGLPITARVSDMSLIRRQNETGQ